MVIGVWVCFAMSESCGAQLLATAATPPADINSKNFLRLAANGNSLTNQLATKYWHDTYHIVCFGRRGYGCN